MIPELSCHLRPMVRKGKSSLFGHISRNLKKTAAVPQMAIFGGSGGTTAVYFKIT